MQGANGQGHPKQLAESAREYVFNDLQGKEHQKLLIHEIVPEDMAKHGYQPGHIPADKMNALSSEVAADYSTIISGQDWNGLPSCV